MKAYQKYSIYNWVVGGANKHQASVALYLGGVTILQSHES